MSRIELGSMRIVSNSSVEAMGLGSLAGLTALSQTAAGKTSQPSDGSGAPHAGAANQKEEEKE